MVQENGFRTGGIGIVADPGRLHGWIVTGQGIGRIEIPRCGGDRVAVASDRGLVFAQEIGRDHFKSRDGGGRPSPTAATATTSATAAAARIVRRMGNPEGVAHLLLAGRRIDGERDCVHRIVLPAGRGFPVQLQAGTQRPGDRHVGGRRRAGQVPRMPVTSDTPLSFVSLTNEMNTFSRKVHTALSSCRTGEGARFRWHPSFQTTWRQPEQRPSVFSYQGIRENRVFLTLEFCNWRFFSRKCIRDEPGRPVRGHLTVHVEPIAAEGGASWERSEGRGLRPCRALRSSGRATQFV